MGLAENKGLGSLEIHFGLDGKHRAENEFGGAVLGGNRLSERLVEIGLKQGENPGSSHGGAAEGKWSEVKAYYRFIDKPDDSAVTMENILLPHRERTIRRMKAERVVLCPQDGNDSNYNNCDQYEEPVQKMLNCGKESGGYCEYICMKCGRDLRRVCFSCKSCFCLSCAKVYADNMVSQVSKKLHPGVIYRHCILTVRMNELKIGSYLQHDVNFLADCLSPSRSICHEPQDAEPQN